MVGSYWPVRRLSKSRLRENYIGKKQAIGGLSRDFYRRLGAIYGQEEMWKFEPSAASKVFSYYLEKAAIPVIYNKYVTKVKKRKGEISSIKLTPAGEGGKKQVISARVFIDCTYEGDLMARSEEHTSELQSLMR